MNKNSIKVPKMKPLEWYDEKPRPFDGKSNGSMAEDDVWVKDRERLYIRYDVRRGANAETDNQWSIFIQFPSKTVRESVESCEAGKIICSHYRKMFWENFYKEMIFHIFN